jgi:hypothetical protein
MRHFYGTPREDMFTGKDIISEIRAAHEKNDQINPLKKSLLMHIDKICNQILKLMKQRKVNLLERFKKLDKSESGTINTIKFEFLLVEKLGLDLKQCELLIKILDKDRLNVVKYQELINWMSSTDNIHAYFERLLV